MYWLIFFNGVDIPVVECAFSTPDLLCGYVRGYPAVFTPYSPYFVFTPEGKSIPLNKFYKNYKEL